MNEPKFFTYQEAGEWFPWGGGHVDGRSFNKRSKTTVKINGIDVHSMKMEDGRVWDCVNGWRPLAAASVFETAVVKALPGLKAEIEADVMASFPTAAEQIARRAIIDDPDCFRDRTADSYAQAYAKRVWSGQSDHVPREERLERVRKALEGQGFSMEGIVL